MNFLLYGIIGFILLIIAYLLGIKHKIELMHDYHMRKVKKTRCQSLLPNDWFRLFDHWCFMARSRYI